MTAKAQVAALAARIGPVRPPRFEVGDRVRVIAMLPEPMDEIIYWCTLETENKACVAFQG